MTGHVRIAFKTSPQGVDWPTLDATWALAGELDVFEAGWMNDHLTDLSQDRGGPSYEPLTVLAALARHVPGRDLGVAVLSNTFRHPSVLAKQATALDNITGGRIISGFVRGIGAEYTSFAIDPRLPKVAVPSSASIDADGGFWMWPDRPISPFGRSLVVRSSRLNADMGIARRSVSLRSSSPS